MIRGILFGLEECIFWVGMFIVFCFVWWGFFVVFFFYFLNLQVLSWFLEIFKTMYWHLVFAVEYFISKQTNVMHQVPYVSWVMCLVLKLSFCAFS